MFRVLAYRDRPTPGAPIELERWIELPFVPAVGMEFDHIFFEDERTEIRSVSWDCRGNYFEVHAVFSGSSSDFDEDPNEDEIRGYYADGVKVDGYPTFDAWLAAHPALP